MGGQLGLTSNKYLLYFRGVLISWVRAHHEIHEIKTPQIFCRFTVQGIDIKNATIASLFEKNIAIKAINQTCNNGCVVGL